MNLIMDVPALQDRQFTYRLPDGLSLQRGAKVRVPFGRGEADGFVVAEAEEPPGIAVRPIKAAYDRLFMPSPSLMSLADRVAEHYCAPLSSVWACLWPPFVPKTKVEGAVASAVPQEEVKVPQREGDVALVRGDAEVRWREYLDRIRRARSSGLGALVLVPEIKAVPSARARLEAAFPGQVSELHSELTGVARRGEYLAVAKGDKPIAVGTRAAVFAPVRCLGIVVIEEESSESYKSPEVPFYDARMVAVLRSRVEGCDVAMGSGHPTVESFWRASQGEFSLVDHRSLPPGPVAPAAVLVNLKEERRGRDIMSAALLEALEKVFAEGNRAVLFLNRRGDSTQVTCQDCGNTLTCKRCGVPLAYHAKESVLVCHTCGLRVEAPEVCPNCGGRSWRFQGFGLERAFSEFQRRFPGIPAFRLDKDTAKDEPAAEVLKAFSSARPACLLATRMVLGYGGMPGVGAVGVLSCDTLLNLPDYRASEKVFHLLWSLKDLLDPGLGAGVFVAQTYNPEHHGVRGILDQEEFYRTELENRRILGYPPYRRFYKVHLYGKNPERVQNSAIAFAAAAREGSRGIDVLGPSPAPKAKVRGEYRWQVALRGSDPALMSAVVKSATQACASSGVKVSADVDPVDMA